MEYNIKRLHNQTVRLSLAQSELDMKIDNFANLNTEKNDKNLNSI